MKKVVLTVVTVMTFAMGFAETTPSHRMRFDRQPVSYDMSFDRHRLAV